MGATVKKTMMRIRRIVFLSFWALIAAACEPSTKTFNGYVEGEYLYIAPTTAGILQNLAVSRGQQVKAGDPLFALDDTNLEASLASAESEVIQANASLQDAKIEFDRAQTLVVREATSKSDYDARKMTLDNAQAEVQVAIQKVIQIKKQLTESAPLAPRDGLIDDTYFNVGEYIAAGIPVVSFLPPENVRIRFFVPQQMLSLFTLGSTVTVRCDGCGKPIKAKINYVASQSEYTPPVIYSIGSRDKLVYRIEAQPEIFTPILKPGLPVDITKEEP